MVFADFFVLLQPIMIDHAEILRRRDMRDVLTFTIDPEDAKDFDDALSFDINEEGDYQIGVHIADVSFFVKEDSKVDREAYERGTSIYLVDRVIPMLPENLCNDICSLRPGEDRLCMSVVFTMGHDAIVKKYKICRTVIHSDYRLTYEQAQSIIDHHPIPSVNHPELISAIEQLHFLALVLRRRRMQAGAMDIEQEEIRFRLDEGGHPVDIFFHKSTESNHLIEEFMLLANRTIATHIGKMDKEMVYRIHDQPDKQKLAEIQRFERRMSEHIEPGTLDMLLIRAMAKAEYSTCNIGHYGLAFDYYTHFTSPIRRYPDLMVHRLVADYVLGERKKAKGKWREDLYESCQHCSAMEQEATQAERDSVKDYQIMWLDDHIGEDFDGHISNVTKYGLFVRLDINHCEGLVAMRNICPGQVLELDEKSFTIRTKHLKGQARHWTSQTDEPVYVKQSFTLGDAVKVRLVRADLMLRQIDLELVTTE